jgi:hypothetical protein
MNTNPEDVEMDVATRENVETKGDYKFHHLILPREM